MNTTSAKRSQRCCIILYCFFCHFKEITEMKFAVSNQDTKCQQIGLRQVFRQQGSIKVLCFQCPAKKGCAEIGMSVCSSKTVHFEHFHLHDSEILKLIAKNPKGIELVMKYKVSSGRNLFTIQAWTACNPQSPNILAVWQSLGP